ncbi:MAG: aminotransferase class I/II-fold pyridoxal phosphate-dependent enzyme [candidate division Zixibacteria bacterium]|nr:aminotransferase class I/II-fold pyridoxal phosphate-dependent enzyme [candidate division Zixibacteria bacterium]
MVPASMVIPFANANDTLDALLQLASQTAGQLVVAGHATAELAIGADRAGLAVHEVAGESPFSADGHAIAAAVRQVGDCVYVANPNRITGTTFSVADLEQIASALGNGLLIIDEYYYDLCGITATVLLDKYPNIVVIRSVSARQTNSASDAGFLLVSPALVDRCREQRIHGPVTVAVEVAITGELERESDLSRRLKLLHTETLRLGSALTRLGAQCRITPTDFLLVRVANPTEVGNRLAENRIPVENLDGYTELRHYLRLQVQSPVENDRVIETLSRLRPALIANRTPEKKAARLHRSPETVAAPAESPERLHRIAISRVAESSRVPTTKSRLGTK